MWKIAKLLDLRVVECEPPPDGASEPISRLTGLCSTKFCRKTVTFIFYIFFRITVMFPCLNFFFKLLSSKNDRMTGKFTDKNIQRGLYVRFRTEMD